MLHWPRVIRLVRASRHVAHALLDDFQALAHFFDAHDAAVIGIAIGRQWYFKFEVLVTRVRARFTHVEISASALASTISSMSMRVRKNGHCSRICANCSPSPRANA